MSSIYIEPSALSYFTKMAAMQSFKSKTVGTLWFNEQLALFSYRDGRDLCLWQ